MPDTSPTPVDLDGWPRDDEISMLSRRALVQHALDVRADLRSTRASIGPDSERIREAEQVIADVLTSPDFLYDRPQPEATAIAAALRAAGLLPGPDNIVVSREALETRLLSSDPHELEIASQILCAALSQPHPAQEQQT